MTNEQILAMATELGASIAKSEEMAAVKELQTRMEADAETTSLLQRYQETRTKLENKMRDGVAILSNEEKHMDLLQQQLNINPKVQEMVKVQADLNVLMQRVYMAINQTMYEEPCSSDCGNCGCGGNCSN